MCRRLGRNIFIRAGIRRNLCCFSLRLQRRPNRIRRAHEPKRDDRSAPNKTIRLPRHGHPTVKWSKRDRSDQRSRSICEGALHRLIHRSGPGTWDVWNRFSLAPPGLTSPKVTFIDRAVGDERDVRTSARAASTLSVAPRSQHCLSQSRRVVGTHYRQTRFALSARRFAFSSAACLRRSPSTTSALRVLA
jgi:hypothetical protein